MEDPRAMEDPRPDWAPRVVEAAFDAVITVDAGRVVGFAAPAGSWLGWTAGKALGRPLDDLLELPDGEPAEGAPLRRLRGRARSREDGTPPVEVTSFPDNERPGSQTLFVRHAPAAGPTDMEMLLTSAERVAQAGSWQLDLRTGETLWSEGMHRILDLEFDPGGRTEDEVLAVVHPDDRARAHDLFATIAEHPERIPEEGLELELRLQRQDGSVREVRALGHLERTASGEPFRWVGSLRDVTGERMAERELQAHYAVSQALREWESFEESVIDLLRRVATALEYPMGSLWLWDEEESALTCRAFWSAPDVHPGEFELAKRSRRFRPGESKVGQAWERRAPVVTTEMDDDTVFIPRDVAKRHGVRSGVAFPAIGPQGPIGVLSLYAFEVHVPSASLRRTLTGIGRELGDFLSRRRAQLGPRPLTERGMEVLRIAAEGNSGPEIAERLFVSPSTIKTHFENIYDKLGVSDRASAVAFALRSGLIQ
jgi:DNA-binding CsgD family transcriptional regulator/PAS domain-containing protein